MEKSESFSAAAIAERHNNTKAQAEEAVSELEFRQGTAFLYLMADGWTRVPPNYREHPCHTEELRKRVDALAAAHCGKGKFDPTHPGVRSRNRWSKAYHRALMMVASPDWWKLHCPAQYALIDPPSLPVSEELQGLSWQEGFLHQAQEPEPVYVDVSPHRKIHYGEPVPESEVLNLPHLWHPKFTGRQLRW
jgi:hypothetical protein